jgi:hypothetical protein
MLADQLRPFGRYGRALNKRSVVKSSQTDIGKRASTISVRRCPRR